ncbi:hypothetical protein IPA_02245 [Ignicoccus pacificus DSM 13166]|uniref:Methyltransferase small domain-containing protein n=1 Tax=Ignicoccus pacificus DSM 13166 TaxID=940294 RepID=A0A977KAP5_9CREN|nr:hypothetical protein IPA_02245 [Ignicoccus pacificus DSM 13166]
MFGDGTIKCNLLEWAYRLEQIDSEIKRGMLDPAAYEAEIKKMYSVKYDDCKPSIKVVLSEDLGSLKLIYDDKYVEIDISKFPLLYPCNCMVHKLLPDFIKKEIVRLPCPLHSKIGDDRIERAFSELAEIEFIVPVYWSSLESLWPPAIDSLILAKIIKERYSSEKIESVLDMGSGTGYLGIVFSSVNKSVKEVTFVDILYAPLLFSIVNARRVKEMELTKANFRAIISNGFKKVKGTYDIIVSIPPYIPFSKASLPSAAFGTSLLKDLTENFSKYSSKLLMVISSVSFDVFNEALSHSGARYKKVAEYEVPFRVGPILGDPEYLKHAIEEGKLYLKKDNPFPLWHKIYVLELSV